MTIRHPRIDPSPSVGARAPAIAGVGAGRRTVRLVITGKVQGVWFRNWMIERAQALGLDGWVRNRADGSVEAVASGAWDVLETLIEACWTGPELARVDQVLVDRPADDPGPGGFRKLPTV